MNKGLPYFLESDPTGQLAREKRRRTTNLAVQGRRLFAEPDTKTGVAKEESLDYPLLSLIWEFVKILKMTK